MLVSFIVPTYNSGLTIEKCLASIKNQKCRKEMLVVDGGSTDDTVKIAKKLGARVITEKKKGIAPARNRGLKEAKGQYIAFVDSDVVLPEDWISKALSILKSNKKLAGTGGPGISYEKGIVAESLNTLLFGIISEKSTDMAETIATMDILYKSDAIKGLSFDEDLPAGEDPEFNLKIKKRGYLLRFDKDLWVYHFHPLKLTSLMKKWYNYGKSRPLLAKKHREFRNTGYYSRLLYIPVLFLFVTLSLFKPIFIAIALAQLLSLFLAYLYISLKTCKGTMVLIFPFVHTLKQLAHMAGHLAGLKFYIFHMQ